MKPGIRTSEFWVMIVSQLLSVGVLTGFIKADFPQAELVALVTNAFTVAVYIFGRSKVKTTGG